MDYITSDQHFFHKNICGEEGFVSTRKHFKNVEEMNEYIISSYNSVVKPGDNVINLGDLCINTKPVELFNVLKRLNGTMEIVKGNHDSSRFLKYLEKHNYEYNGKPKFTIIPMGKTVKREGVVYYLTHYPQGLGEYRKNIRNLCGHIHEEVARESNILNVGVDSPEISNLGIPFGTPVDLNVAMDLVTDKWESWKEKVNRNA